MKKAKANKPTTKKIYPALIVLAGVMWGMISLFTRSLGNLGLSSLEISGVRCLVATPVLAIVLLIINIKQHRTHPENNTAPANNASANNNTSPANSTDITNSTISTNSTTHKCGASTKENADIALEKGNAPTNNNKPKYNTCATPNSNSPQTNKTQNNLFSINLRDIWLFAGAGILSFLMFGFLYFQCIQLSEVSVAVILLYTSPAWLILLGRVLLKERMSLQKLGALALTITGCVLVSGVVGNSVALSPLAILCGLGSGITYALYSVFGTIAMRKYDSLTFTFYAFLFAALAALVACNPAHIVQVALQNASAIPFYAGIGIVCTVFPFLLYTAGLSHVQASRAGILATSEPVVSCIVGVCVFGENLDAIKGAGIALVLASLFLANKETKT